MSGIRDYVFLFEREIEEKVQLVRNVVDKVKNLIEWVQLYCRSDPVVVNIVSRFLSVFEMLYRKPQYLKIFANNNNVIYMYMCMHSLVFSLEGWAWQEPEPSHVTGMALAQCILGKYLGVVCHCFLLPLDVPTLAAKYLRTQRRERS